MPSKLARIKHLATTVETTNSVGAKMILIPPGEFLMGSTDGQGDTLTKAATRPSPLTLPCPSYK